MKHLFLSLIISLLGLAGFAQSGLKIGHINSQELLAAMPENDSAQAKFDKVLKEYQSTLETMQVELNNKMQDYKAKMKDYSDLIRQTKESELQDLDQRIQQFRQEANDNLPKQRDELYRPALDKAKKAITDVAKENNFTYILDLSLGAVIYTSDNSIDILPLVKQKLGIGNKK